MVETTHTQQSSWRIGFFITLGILVFLLIGGTSLGVAYVITHFGRTTTLINTAADGNKIVTSQQSNIAAVASKVSPSVVSITTSLQAQSFYGTTSEQGAGTGIIISKDGYVITNNHVIDGASTVTVVDNDGNSYSNVKVIGRDPLNDIAFLKINANKSFTPAEIGNSSTVSVGQQVVAIGNALGQYQNTVTSGILSGTDRPVTAQSDNGSSSESLVDLLQTDASINPGNSGGPLLNLAGQVIGINSAVASNANGIGFAIPINSEKGVIAGVLQDGKVERSYLGVNYVSITPAVAQQDSLPVNAGAYINNGGNAAVLSGGPGDKAGLKDGDIVQKVNNDTVGPQGGLSTLLGQYRPGDTVSLTVLRGGKTLTLSATLGMYSS